MSASLFAVCHLTNLEYTVSYNVIIQVIYAFFMGLLFSALLIRTNNVWLLGLVHGLLNSIVTGCETNNHLMSGTGTTSTFFEYVIQMLGVTLIFSPMLFVYWMLIKTIPKKLS
ncbi:MAG: CPBP family intramembrane metalloprotease [Chitinophagaceae bacterium]|nr:CPBP family intramembrane metalloprotease [Chitinophagaceae bacterium]